MQILLDTHIYLWWLKDDRQLSKKARHFIADADIVYVSSVSIWEAAIKIQLGKLCADLHDLVNSIESEGFVELVLQSKQAAMLTTLPLIHNDPFDRILIAQAISEPVRLITADEKLKHYTELVEIV